MDLKAKHYYNFSTYGSSSSSKEFKGVYVSGADVTYGIVRKLGYDPHAMFVETLPSLPQGIERDVTKYTYYIVSRNGREEIVPSEWIIPSTIVESHRVNFQVTINNVDDATMERVRTALLTMDIQDFSITQVS